MSITFTKAYVANGKTFATLREAQFEAISELTDGASRENLDIETIIGNVLQVLLDNSDEVINILTTTESSRPKARAVNGGRKPRKSRITEPATTTAA